MMSMVLAWLVPGHIVRNTGCWWGAGRSHP